MAETKVRVVLQTRMKNPRVLNITGVAKKAGLSKSAVSRILSSRNRNPRFETAEKIAKVLGIDVWELMQGLKKGKKYVEVSRPLIGASSASAKEAES